MIFVKVLRERDRSWKLSAAGMAEEFNVQAGTETKAFPFANFEKPRGARGQSFGVGALGHEEDSV